MNSGLGSLHRILKDETRRKIVHLLNEKGTQAYGDLMKGAGVMSTGKMNYHLKVLDDLIEKNADGQYGLTEKGKLASRLMLEFPNGAGTSSGSKPKWWRTFWISQIIFVATSLAINAVLYLYGYIDQNRLIYQSTVVTIGIVGFSYMITHVLREVLSEKGRMRFNRFVFIGAGIFILGFVFWIAEMKITETANLMPLIDSTVGGDVFAVASFLACYIAGAFIGNWIGKRRQYNLPQLPV